MLETKKKFSQLRIHGAEISSAAISRSHHALLLRAVRSGGQGGAHPSVFGRSVSPISTGGRADNAPNLLLAPPPDFQTFQNPCCSVLVAFLAPSYPFLLKVIGNKRFYIFRLLNKPIELIYFAQNPSWHVFWQVSSSAPKHICY